MLFQRILSIAALATTLLEGSMSAALPDKDISGDIYLVNRDHMISEDYVPDGRTVDVRGARQSMREDAAAALEEMFAAAKSESGINLVSVSGYRSYSKQRAIYSRKLKSTGSAAKANLLVALPGASEHQLGLAMDLGTTESSKLISSFGKTKAGIWVSENAHRFGFIVRYQQGYEDVTGYSYEPWHVRYVGRPHAQAVFDMGLPLEHYLSAHRAGIYEYLINSSLK